MVDMNQMRTSQDLSSRLGHARELLRTARHAAMATVNEDGSPHNTPYAFLIDKDLRYLYWASHPEARHSQNVTRTGQVFVVVFDTYESGKAGVYLRGEGTKVLEGAELEDGVAILNQHWLKTHDKPLPIANFVDASPYRMYRADITEATVNMSERDEKGMFVREYRQPVKPEDLLG